jgi:hypothetical protein
MSAMSDAAVPVKASPAPGPFLLQRRPHLRPRFESSFDSCSPSMKTRRWCVGAGTDLDQGVCELSDDLPLDRFCKRILRRFGGSVST